MAIHNFQDQVKLLQSMFSHLSREEMVNLIFPTQTGKAPVASPSNAGNLASREDTYPCFGGDPQTTLIQSPRFSPLLLS